MSLWEPAQPGSAPHIAWTSTSAPFLGSRWVTTPCPPPIAIYKQGQGIHICATPKQYAGSLHMPLLHCQMQRSHWHPIPIQGHLAHLVCPIQKYACDRRMTHCGAKCNYATQSTGPYPHPILPLHPLHTQEGWGWPSHFYCGMLGVMASTRGCCVCVLVLLQLPEPKLAVAEPE
jgi:hypothetical protein